MMPYLKNIVKTMRSANLISNDSQKITQIRQKYNISLPYKTAINFLSLNTQLVTYSSSFGNFYAGNLFSNSDKVCIEFFI